MDARTAYLMERTRRTEDGCWLWTGGTYPDGYGRAVVDRRGVRAHRLAWEVFVGPIPAGRFICHTCDTPPCVNPAHLFLGDHAANMADRDAKGRTLRGDQTTARRYPERLARGSRNGAYTHPERVRRGEQITSAKLTGDQAAAIRRRYAAGGVTQYALAQEFGVDQSVVSDIVRGRIWKEG
jgi:hypothetical protein